MRKAILFLLILYLPSFISCSRISEFPDTPEGVHQALITYQIKNQPEKAAELISEYSIQALGVSRDEILQHMKKVGEEFKFKGAKLLDYRVVRKEDLGDNMFLIHGEIKYQLETQEKPIIETIKDVVYKEGRKWKVNTERFIRKIEYADKCGTKGNISICIKEAYIFSDYVILKGTVENTSKSKYSYGFAQPSIVRIKTDKGEEAAGDHPSGLFILYKLQQRIPMDELEAIPPGKKDEIFMIGSDLEPVLIKGIPISFSIDKIVKLGWGNLPASIGDEGFEISINLK